MRSGILFAALAVLACGCSGGADDRVAVYKVTGKVTMAGSPFAGASVSFAPAEGQRAAVGKTADDGTFELTTYAYGDGAAKGKFDVLISKSNAPAAAATAGAGHDAMAAGSSASPPVHSGGKKKGGGADGNLVNPKYSKPGELTATVTAAGPNEFTFALEP